MTISDIEARIKGAEAQYRTYAQKARIYPRSIASSDALTAMAALAVSHANLDLFCITPEHLRQPLINLLMQWQDANLSVNTQHAIDRLHGLYGQCVRCGELRMREIGGIRVATTEHFDPCAPHVCEDCRTATT